MFKKIVLFFLLLGSLWAKPTGCELSVYGDVWITISGKEYPKAHYRSNVKSGKNFHTIFVGSVIATKAGAMKIIDIKADKRVDKHRRGSVKVSLIHDDFVEIVNLKYDYYKGYFSASGYDREGKKVGFALHIKALLCNAKR